MVIFSFQSPLNDYMKHGHSEPALDVRWEVFTGDWEVCVDLVKVCLCCLRSSLEMFPRDVWLE